MADKPHARRFQHLWASLRRHWVVSLLLPIGSVVLLAVRAAHDTQDVGEAVLWAIDLIRSDWFAGFFAIITLVGIGYIFQDQWLPHVKSAFRRRRPEISIDRAFFTDLGTLNSDEPSSKEFPIHLRVSYNGRKRHTTSAAVVRQFMLGPEVMTPLGFLGEAPEIALTWHRDGTESPYLAELGKECAPRTLRLGVVERSENGMAFRPGSAYATLGGGLILVSSGDGEGATIVAVEFRSPNFNRIVGIRISVRVQGKTSVVHVVPVALMRHHLRGNFVPIPLALPSPKNDGSLPSLSPTP